MKDERPVPTTLNHPFHGLMAFQLRQASVLVAADLGERLADLSLTMTNLTVLLMIQSNPGVTQTELGKVLGIQRANLAPLTATFAARGLIKRNRIDGRSYGLSLTSGGADLAARAWEHVRANEMLLPHRLSAVERAAIVDLLQSLRPEPPGHLQGSPL
ncbi:MarR family winged helix-turn-helix transcriptional regulator [Brevundimonas sp.]|jgi:DNA-binding MarR family transcriptional regulator|uniref:MarR family winged helix-turn-helix transcriptional regulator n=1 Tax=Brevundimonas sp. TaxID=1871086 RepID=UPI00378505EC